MKPRPQLTDIDLFLMDMDGTIYHENEIIPGALEFFSLLRSQGKHYAFMTNNSSKGRKAYVEKLTRLGIVATEEQIVSSVNATVHYLNSVKPKAKIYLIGTKSLKSELLDEGFVVLPLDYRGGDVDFVLLGYDTELTYQKLEGACYHISNGTSYIATNCDLRCPVRDGRYVPDCGAMAKLICDATGVMPRFLGKPERTMVDAAAAKWGVPMDKIACVGDRLYTDIKVGINAGSATICVLTGEATRNEIEGMEMKPDYVLPSIKELYEELK